MQPEDRTREMAKTAEAEKAAEAKRLAEEKAERGRQGMNCIWE